MMEQCVAGCAHIAAKRMVHMDLAARNVLVGANNRCQIADFGLTNKMEPGKNYFKLPERIALAMKWMAPEALESMIFSEASDVWSIGVVCWEILAYGAFPLKELRNAEVLPQITQGYRMRSVILRALAGACICCCCFNTNLNFCPSSLLSCLLVPSCSRCAMTIVPSIYTHTHIYIYIHMLTRSILMMWQIYSTATRPPSQRQHRCGKSLWQRGSSSRSSDHHFQTCTQPSSNLAAR